MSRVAKQPIILPHGVNVSIAGQDITVKGSKGEMTHHLHQLVQIKQEQSTLSFTPANDSIEANAQAGTARAVLNNMVVGVSQGFEKKLSLVGVGYRAKVTGDSIELTLGFSHPVKHDLPKGVTAVAPSQTELVISGFDKQAVGQVAADIRAYRPPEPYKGKGVRYADEQIVRKETKKK